MYDDDHSNSKQYCSNSRGRVVGPDSPVTVSGTVPLFNHEMQAYALVSTAPVCVNYRVSTDADIVNVVSTGTAYTSSDIDYTIKVSGKRPAL